MRFFFKWIEADSPLSLDEGNKTDLDILDLVIAQKEGEVALCQLTVPLDSQLRKNGCAVVFIECEGKITPLFRGKLMNIPLHVSDRQQRIEFFAIPDDVESKLARIRDEIHQSGEWDELFTEIQHRHDPVEALEAVPALFCWDPVSHEVVLSNLFQGRKTRQYNETQILEDSFHIKIAGLPKPYVKVSVIAEWVQESMGEINPLPGIERQFEGWRINTFTPKSLLSSWPKTGQFLGRSGYHVVDSKLAPFNPGTTGVLGIYPQKTEKITFTEGSAQSAYLKRTWFTGRLKLGWHYRQRRREIVSFELQHRNQLLHRAEAKKLDLILNLTDVSQELPDPSTASFFETERGLKAINHAVKMARCHLAASARGIEVLFKVPLAEALFLSLDESIKIHHHAFKGGSVTGKIIGYKLNATFEKRWAEIKVAIATGEEGTDVLQTEVDLVPEAPIAGLPDVKSLDLNEFVELVSVKNQAGEQIEAIQEVMPKSLDELKQLMTKKQTEISIKLKDIRSVDVLERRFSVKKPLCWSAPAQISLL